MLLQEPRIDCTMSIFMFELQEVLLCKARKLETILSRDNANKWSCLEARQNFAVLVDDVNI